MPNLECPPYYLECIFTLVIFIGDFLSYVQNPAIDGLYTFIVSVVPFVIACAFTAKGEEIAQSFARTS